MFWSLPLSETICNSSKIKNRPGSKRKLSAEGIWGIQLLLWNFVRCLHHHLYPYPGSHPKKSSESHILSFGFFLSINFLHPIFIILLVHWLFFHPLSVVFFGYPNISCCSPLVLTRQKSLSLFPQEALLKVLSIEELQDFARAHAACCSLDDGPMAIKHGRRCETSVEETGRKVEVVDRFCFRKECLNFTDLEAIDW